MKKYLLRFYRCFFSSRGRKKIKKIVYSAISVWFLCIFVQRLIYPEYVLPEWYIVSFIYCILFYLGIMVLPWNRYTLITKLRIFQIYSFAFTFLAGMALYSLHRFFLLNSKPATGYSIELVLF